MIFKISIMLMLASAVIGGIPISSYYAQPQASTTILRQPYPLYQNFVREPAYLTPAFQYYQPKIVKHQIVQAQHTYQPTFITKQPGQILQAEPRKLVLQEPETADPNYSFAYAVNDEKTGDIKSHQESRKGDNVVGKYTVVEPDGTLRIVRYTAGKEGFNAVVERQPAYTTPTTPNQIVIPQKQFPVRKIIAQSQPIYFNPIVHSKAPAAPSTLAFSNYYYQ